MPNAGLSSSFLWTTDQRNSDYRAAFLVHLVRSEVQFVTVRLRGPLRDFFVARGLKRPTFAPSSTEPSGYPDRRVLLASNYNAWPEAFNGQAYSFLEVVRTMECADVLAPAAPSYMSGRLLRPAFSYLTGELLARSYSQIRSTLNLSRHAPGARDHVAQDYDLFFFMCQFPLELSCLNRISGWRERSRLAVAFILETWPHLLRASAPDLRVLNKFDHVFVLNARSVDDLRKMISTPCSFLPTAADCLAASPYPDPPPRTVDVYSMGRRPSVVHEQLIDHARRNARFLYIYDVMQHGTILNWRDSRLLTSSLIKRSKFFLAYDPRNTAGDALSTRYFEGAAGGAVLIGSAPPCPEFASCFDWDDAVVEIPADEQRLPALLERLSSDPDRLAAISKRNAIECLRRHDWAHRWDAILGVLGLERSALLTARLGSLDALAAHAEWPSDPEYASVGREHLGATEA